MNTPYSQPPRTIPGLDEWNAANQRAREEYYRAPFAHSAGPKERPPTWRAERQAAYRVRRGAR